MTSVGDRPNDLVAVFHNGLVLARAPLGTDTWSLPAAHGLRGQQLAHAVSRLLDTPTHPSPPIEGHTGDGQPLVLAAVEVPARAAPAPTTGHTWLTPEQCRAALWAEPCRAFIDGVIDRQLDGTALLGGRPGKVVRVGGSVRRPTGFWSPAVHAGLHHLQQWGLDGVPEVLGTDERGREILSYLPGNFVNTDRDDLNDIQIAEVASWTLRFHEATREFIHPGPFRLTPSAAPTVMGHNDLGPHNLVFAGNRLIGIIDWDLFGPTTPELELAWLTWTAVPFHRPVSLADSVRRTRLIADTYDIDALAVLDAIPGRLTMMANDIRQGATLGDEDCAALLAAGEPDSTLALLADARDRLAATRRALAAH